MGAVGSSSEVITSLSKGCDATAECADQIPGKRLSKMNPCDPDSDCSTATPCCRSPGGSLAGEELADLDDRSRATPRDWTVTPDAKNGIELRPCHSGILYSQAVFADVERVPEPTRPLDTWLGRLTRGTELALDGETVRVKLDTELWCLEIVEHELLYPIAELSTCTPVVANGDGTKPDEVFDLEVAFSDFDVLVFQFDRVDHRTSFAVILNVLANQARKEQFADRDILTTSDERFLN